MLSLAGDTALGGNTPALMCGYAFFGAEHVLFGTDMGFSASFEKILDAVEQMSIPDEDKYQIFEGNAKRLLRISA